MNVIILIHDIHVYSFLLVVPEIISSEDEYVTNEQLSVVFQCTVVGIPLPVMTWYRGDSMLMNDSRISITSSVMTLSSSLLQQVTQNLTLLNTTDSDSGNYSCTANSSAGMDMAQFGLVVRSECLVKTCLQLYTYM